MHKLSQRQPVFERFMNASSPGEAIDILLEASSPERIDNAVHDYIQVICLDPTLSKEFRERGGTEIYREEIDEFKDCLLDSEHRPNPDAGVTTKTSEAIKQLNIPLARLPQLEEEIKDVYSIGRMCDLIIKYIPEQSKSILFRKYIEQIYYRGNTGAKGAPEGDLDQFKQTVAPHKEFWFPQQDLETAEPT